MMIITTSNHSPATILLVVLVGLVDKAPVEASLILPQTAILSTLPLVATLVALRETDPPSLEMMMDSVGIFQVRRMTFYMI